MPACTCREGDTPIKLLIAHSSADVVEDVSTRLHAEGIPHYAILGDLSRPRELLRAAYQAGVQDIQDFLFIQSLVREVEVPVMRVALPRL